MRAKGCDRIRKEVRTHLTRDSKTWSRMAKRASALGDRRAAKRYREEAKDDRKLIRRLRK